ncbi:MAG: hydroxymethylbilane synthase [Gordonibacter sp.]|uniref:hydroxymethylbilane synthase n=1 Tax=Gordonibacter sp. TaxID=1968902 RepID=UPI002FC967FE
MDAVRIGTRKSELAMWQARWVQSRLQECYPAMRVELVPLDTQGDKKLDVPLPSVADKGFFTAEIEQDLYERRIDIAVHSLKDLPTELPEGLAVGAYCERADAHDAFLGKGGIAFADLPENACIGTSSLRRAAQLRRMRPDLVCVDIRGNLNTRWRKLQEDDRMAGIVLAAAGVLRLGWSDRISSLLPYDSMLPAPGQGIIAVECLVGRSDIEEVLSAVNHVPSERAARAERTFQACLEGGCQTPIGAIADCAGDVVKLDAGVFSLDGTQAVRVRVQGESAEDVGRLAAEQALRQGAKPLLAAIRG